MSTHRKHRVELHRWVNGVLHSSTHLFDSMVDAMSWGDAQDAHAVKVYNDNGDLVHSSTGASNSYA